MSLYLDTNVVYSFVFEDAYSARADIWMARQSVPIVVVDWAKVEFHALVRRLVRAGALKADVAGVGFADFERFIATQTRGLALAPSLSNSPATPC